ANNQTSLNQHSPDNYEVNNSLNTPYEISSLTSSTLLENANIHIAGDDDYYAFSLTGNETLKLDVLFSHDQGDVDIKVLDTFGLYVDSSSSATDNETISLSYLQAGDYVLHVYGYNDATNADYSILFSNDDTSDNWTQDDGDWIDWQVQTDASTIAADAYEDNDTHITGVHIGTLDGNENFSNLTIDTAGDDDYYYFYYDPNTPITLDVNFEHDNGDLDIDLWDWDGNWLDGSYTDTDNENMSLVGYSAGYYVLKIYGYEGSVHDNYTISTQSISSTADIYEDNNSFATAFYMGEASGYEGEILDLNLSQGDEDWFRATFTNTGSSESFLTANFDHQDGDINIELYDSLNNLVRSSNSLSDNETIYFSDLGIGDYYLRVYSHSNTVIQNYTLNYSFPTLATDDTVSADNKENNNTSVSATQITQDQDIINNLTLHSATDIDWFKFDIRNSADQSSFAHIDYDDFYGEVTFSLLASDVGSSDLAQISSSSTGQGYESLNLSGLTTGTYYLKVQSQDGDLIPSYSLNLNLIDVEGSTNVSETVVLDEFEIGLGNNTKLNSTSIGNLNSTFSRSDLTIHDASDLDWFEFKTEYAGETTINLNFLHDSGDIDVNLYNQNDSVIGSSGSGNNNESIIFNSNTTDTYYLKVYGYDGATNNNYDLSIQPVTLNARPDDYESNNTFSTATMARNEQSTFEGLTLHNGTDEDWFEFSISENGNTTNSVNLTNYIGGTSDVIIYNSDGTTVKETHSLSDGNLSISTADYSTGDYFAQIKFADAAATSLANYNMLIDTSITTNSDLNDWTIMVYVAGDNDLHYAAIDDLNEMEAVNLSDGVEIVTLTDLSSNSADWLGSTTPWTTARQGQIQYDINGYNSNYWISNPANQIVSQLDDLGELNMGDPATLTNFLNYSTANNPAENYALILWDHGGGLSGVAWDDTNNHDNLNLSEIQTAVSQSNTFSTSNPLNLIGYDACLMQTLEFAEGMSDLANVMVAAQEIEPGDGWDYKAFLTKLSLNPDATANTLSEYIVDTYYEFYEGGWGDQLSSIDLTKIDDLMLSMASFNTVCGQISNSDWNIIRQAQENAWNSPSKDYGQYGDDMDLMQFFKYIEDNSSSSDLQSAANVLVSNLETAIIANSNDNIAGGLSAAFLDSNYATSYYDSYSVNWNESHWTDFLELFDRSSQNNSTNNTNGGPGGRSNSTDELSRDYAETLNALGASTNGNNSSFTAFEVGNISSNTDLANLTLHDTSDVDWFTFSTPEELNPTGNTVIVNSTNSTNMTAELYDNALSSLAVRSGSELTFDLESNETYFVRISSDSVRQDISYEVDFTTNVSSETIVRDIAEGTSSNDTIGKASAVEFFAENNTVYENLTLNLGESDQDWFELSSGRISEQSPNLFTVELIGESVALEEDIIIKIVDSNGTILTTSNSLSITEAVVLENYTSDIFVNITSGTNALVDYKLNLQHADYDLNSDGIVSVETDGAGLIGSMFSNVTNQEIADNIYDDSNSENITSYLTSFRNNLLDVDGDGIINPLTDGLIIEAHMAGATTAQLLPLISNLSPIASEDELLTHLLEIG
ncbi:clostripain-related cysteine peptidase, partial [Paracoccaceae bacterium]|nr:clostripain-related cysteine peptidase [Paracoccaceae bacterium]